MAQVLKEEVRQSIIKAAKEEFLEKGYKDASLRNIAKKANMTVGNLYRYYKSKSDISNKIIGSTYEELKKIVKEIADKKIPVQASVYNVKMDSNELKVVLEELADKMIDLFEKNKDEFNILMMYSNINDELTNWFIEIIKNLIAQNYMIAEHINKVDALIHSYAEAMYAGLRDLFMNKELDFDNLRKLLKIYFRSFVNMLDNDFRRFISEE